MVGVHEGLEESSISYHQKVIATIHTYIMVIARKHLLIYMSRTQSLSK